jgi:hypothetical protein
VPLAPPVSLIAIGFLAEAMGHKWNIHGEAAVLAALLVLTSFAAFIFELFALPTAIKRLRRIPEERTPFNLACTGFALAFVGAWLFFVAWMVKGLSPAS